MYVNLNLLKLYRFKICMYGRRQTTPHTHYVYTYVCTFMYKIMHACMQLQRESLTTLDSPFAALFLNSAWERTYLWYFY